MHLIFNIDGHIAGPVSVHPKANPTMQINACSPGWIETDLSRPFAVAAGKTPQEMGMLQPEQGATCKTRVGGITDGHAIKGGGGSEM